MNTYTIKKVTEGFDWDTLPVMPVRNVLWTEDFGIFMDMKLAYDEDFLYVHQRAYEKDIRAVETDKLAQVCSDSCMEFFFSLGSDAKYFNFEMNLLGTCYMGFGAERKSRIRLVAKDIASFAITPERLSDGWQLCYCIPVSFLRLFEPQLPWTSGFAFTGNGYKCGDLTPHPHFLSWNPVETEKPDFHRPEYFGKLILE